jgi:hypothetical protein
MARNPMSTSDRVATALERIVDALEAQNAADPLTMLSMAMESEDAPEVLRGDSQKPFASNGATIMYRHPVDGFEIVARRDASCEGGYSVKVEPA